MKTATFTITYLEYNSEKLTSVLATSFDGIDTDKICEISFKFEQLGDAKQFAAQFTKAYQGNLSGVTDRVANTTTWFVKFSFHTFTATKMTGNENEAAIARRKKVIAKINSL